MDTEDIGKKLEQFRQYLAETVMHREDLMLNVPDPETANIYRALYTFAKGIEQEFDGTFSTEPTIDEQT